MKTHHKFVNTTPKPNATKNNKGELGPPVDPEVPVVVCDGADPVAVAVFEIVDMFATMVWRPTRYRMYGPN